MLHSPIPFNLWVGLYSLPNIHHSRAQCYPCCSVSISEILDYICWVTIWPWTCQTDFSTCSTWGVVSWGRSYKARGVAASSSQWGAYLVWFIAEFQPLTVLRLECHMLIWFLSSTAPVFICTVWLLRNCLKRGHYVWNKCWKALHTSVVNDNSLIFKAKNV